MKQNYDTGQWYDIDIKDFDLQKELKQIDLYKHDYIKKVNEAWLKVIKRIYEREDNYCPETILQTFSVDRLNTSGDKLIYDIGFSIDTAKSIIRNKTKRVFKALDEHIDNDLFISYTQRNNPYTMQPNEPIIIVPDFVNSREARFRTVNEIPNALLVIDGNNRVTLMKEQKQSYINCYYISLDELLENNVFLNELDSAVYCQMADLVYILKHIDNPNINEIIKDYYKESYLVKYFSRYI